MVKSNPRLGPRISVVQVDTRDPNSAAHDQKQEHILSVRYNQHICAQKGWDYTFVNVKDLCQRQAGKYCDPNQPRNFGAPWLKVIALLYLVEKTRASSESTLYGNDAMNNKDTVLDAGRTLFVFLDSDAVLTAKSHFVPEALRAGATHTPAEPEGRSNTSEWVGSHIWVARDMGFYGGLCGPDAFANLPYRTCINSGLIALYPTADTSQLLRNWWDALSWNGTTPWQTYDVPQGDIRNNRAEWPYEQDSVSIMLSFPPLPITSFLHNSLIRGSFNMHPNPSIGFPISHIYHTGQWGAVKKIKELIKFIVANMEPPRTDDQMTPEMLFAAENVPFVKHENIVQLTTDSVVEMLNRPDFAQGSANCHEYKVMRGTILNTCEHWKPPVIDWNKWRVEGSVSPARQQPQETKGPIGCNETCHGKPTGMHRIGGVNNVYCEDNKALISVFINTRYGWRYKVWDDRNFIESNEISPERPGWRPWAGDVERLAQLSTHVILHNVDRGTLVSVDNRAVGALQQQHGTWHSQDNRELSERMFEQIKEGEGDKAGKWCFSTSCPSTRATGWPNMYESCGHDECVHWLSERKFSRFAWSHYPIVSPGSATWLGMPPPTDDCA